MAKSDQNIEQTVAKALDAFWDVIGDENPDAVSGDLSPMATILLDEAATAAVREWIANNCR